MHDIGTAQEKIYVIDHTGMVRNTHCEYNQNNN